MLLVANTDLLPGDDASVATAQAQDSQVNTFSLPVEAVVKVPTFDWITEVIVRLPDELANLNQDRLRRLTANDGESVTTIFGNRNDFLKSMTKGDYVVPAWVKPDQPPPKCAAAPENFH